VHIKAGQNLETGILVKYIWYTTARNFSNKRKCRSWRNPSKGGSTPGGPETRQKVKGNPEKRSPSKGGHFPKSVG